LHGYVRCHPCFFPLVSHPVLLSKLS
jgi:hypothetical protein